MMRNGIIAVLVALMFAAPLAGAQQMPPYDVKVAFTETDLNADGAIEINEFFERLVDVFFLGDANKDGFLTEDEFVKVVVIKEDFTEIDTSKEGKVSKREFIAARLPLFMVIDTDGDSALSLAEVSAAYEGRSAK